MALSSSHFDNICLQQFFQQLFSNQGIPKFVKIKLSKLFPNQTWSDIPFWDIPSQDSRYGAPKVCRISPGPLGQAGRSCQPRGISPERDQDDPRSKSFLSCCRWPSQDPCKPTMGQWPPDQLAQDVALDPCFNRWLWCQQHVPLQTSMIKRFRFENDTTLFWTCPTYLMLCTVSFWFNLGRRVSQSLPVSQTLKWYWLLWGLCGLSTATPTPSIWTLENSLGSTRVATWRFSQDKGSKMVQNLFCWIEVIWKSSHFRTLDPVRFMLYFDGEPALESRWWQDRHLLCGYQCSYGKNHHDAGRCPLRGDAQTWRHRDPHDGSQHAPKDEG